ncbi:plastocyanin/azurin family copper-binding protein [Larkinella terrae]|uniref:Auracyanin family protein n=1 Tax=Larkinella terrae TaxID=2025311 RepID=A0A7K0ESU7_9BACT|nr:plastocyanin/azurin family copper-binding protein [Larkinella terrae]MRS64887.1 auracyanin family protein [Larkinella terrae]
MKNRLSFLLFPLFLSSLALAQRPLTEDDYYRLITIPMPEAVQLEVGGMAVLPDGRLGVSTRRGEVWLISNPYMKGSRQPQFKRFAYGLHEPLGLAYHKGALYATQRGELTKMIDTDGDDEANEYQSIVKWPLSGNYHEYSYGPLFLPDGDMMITLNLDWIGYGASLAKWRGWMLKVNEKGELKPYATGLRSPSSFRQLRDGSIFYTENQGDWVGSGRMTHLELGDFAGNPAGLRWSSEPGSPIKLKPEDVPSTGKPMHEVAKTVKGLKVPAIWFPHTLMGISTSDILEDTTANRFGPFDGQLFVGDQGHSKVMRVFLEKVDGEYQGACFPFRSGFQSGILRMAWGLDGSMFVGQTSRGWAATGKDPFGVQRLVWTGQTPFEMKAIRSMPDGFEVEFTLPVDKKTASDLASYSLNSFTYKYHRIYGSPVEDARPVPIRGVVVSDNGLKVRIVADTVLREGYVHEVKAEGLKSAAGLSLLHNTGYYTLNHIAPGTKLTIAAPVKHNHGDMAMASTKTEPPVSGAKGKSAAGAKRVTEQPADWTNGPDQVITIGTVPGLKFDKTQVEVKAGSRIRWVFNNNDDMLHNCVIVKPATANAVGDAALRLNLNGSKMQYVPVTPNVLFHTNLLQPESSESLYFVAPATPGDYQFVCTFPGHSSLMQGVMKVVK